MAECVFALRGLALDRSDSLACNRLSGQLFQESLPAISTRRVACTHIRVTRVYGTYACNHCGKVPRLGWVYRCAQDHNGHLHPEGDEKPPVPVPSVSENEVPRLEEPEEGNAGEGRLTADMLQLKPWMLKGIVNGTYSPQHVDILKAQRQRVKDTIRTTEQSFREYIAGQQYQQMIHAATDSNTTSPESTQPLTLIPASDRLDDSGLIRRMYPECTYQACSCCRYVLDHSPEIGHSAC